MDDSVTNVAGIMIKIGFDIKIEKNGSSNMFRDRYNTVTMANEPKSAKYQKLRLFILVLCNL